eukprot:TRINITY_DN3292_c0_g3_i1.p1 TRINITY_DN3292_c0_g3~~TRINITY_DN3292_c0_g3_i1.p1  ORF type:complete len:311 (+),score=117.30 TRINITY_DN3292_c0_g3_i1:220-1152(+)
MSAADSGEKREEPARSLSPSPSASPPPSPLPPVSPPESSDLPPGAEDGATGDDDNDNDDDDNPNANAAAESGSEAGSEASSSAARAEAAASDLTIARALHEEELACSEHQAAHDRAILRRLEQMMPCSPLAPRTNLGLATPPGHGLASTDDDVLFEGHLRIQTLLHTYGLREKTIPRDGNCMFASFSDQLFGTARHHAHVRKRAVATLLESRAAFAQFVPGDYDAYCRTMSRRGTWGDHLALKALAECYGVQVCLVTSYEAEPFVTVEPEVRRSEKIIWMSFFAEIHYNSVYGEGELCPDEVPDRKCAVQ